MSGHRDGLGGENGVAQRGVRSLNSEVAEDGGVGLDAVALLVIVGHVQELQAEVGPLAPHHLCIQPPHTDHELLQRQCAAGVRTLQQQQKGHVYLFCISTSDRAVQIILCMEKNSSSVSIVRCSKQSVNKVLSVYTQKVTANKLQCLQSTGNKLQSVYRQQVTVNKLRSPHKRQQ